MTVRQIQSRDISKERRTILLARHVAVVEKGAVPGITVRGNTRILVVGDSLFLANNYLDKWANRDFANSAVNWLLDRAQLTEAIGPRPVTEFHLNMNALQRRNVQWLLLAALPGGILFFGGLVWLRRRK